MTLPNHRYEQLEAFGSSFTGARRWNYSSLQFVERFNGRAAMLGFTIGVAIEYITGLSITCQLRSVLGWYLSLGIET